MTNITKAALLLFLVPVTAFSAQDLEGDVAELRQLITSMQADYERRISELEARLDTAERAAGSAQRDADEAVAIAEQATIDLSSGSSAANKPESECR